MTLALAAVMLGAVTTAGEAIAARRDHFLSALLAPDTPRAREVVDDAVAGGVRRGDIDIDVLQPALDEVGRRWG